MKNYFLIFTVLICCSLTGCDEPSLGPRGEGQHVKKYPADVAIQWINLQQKLIKTTPGFDPLVAGRSFAYSGLTLYESVLKGIPFCKSVISPLVSTDINMVQHRQVIHWPASANAAMAFILKNLFANTSTANKATIDSLESAFTLKFQNETNLKILSESADYGRKIATHIFEWSKTDGGHEAYLKATSDTYVPPTG